MSYDQANRLTSFGANASYAYNGGGLRMSRTVSGISTQQVWDVAEGMPMLIQDGTTSYITGLHGLPLEQISGSGTVTYYHQDQLGSSRSLTDSTGLVVGTATYDAYGKTTATTGTTTPLGFAGSYTDTESGLLYLRARYLDPSTGQFISRDPITRTTRQPYSYVADNPLNSTDPSGLIGVSLCRGGSGGVPFRGVLGAFGVGGFGSVQVCLTATLNDNGQTDIAVTGGGGGGGGIIGGRTIAGGRQFQFSPTAQTVDDFGGSFTNFGGSASAVPEFPWIIAGMQSSSGSNCGREQSVFEGSFGVGIPGGEVHTTETYTWVNRNLWAILAAALTW